MKDKFIKAYTENITRPGADKLLAWIESSDFFTAPASTRFHLSSPGGLLEHSLHVFVVDDKLPYGHGEKSVYIISGFMRLSREEAMAIRWHMGFSDNDFQGGGYSVGNAFDKFPLAVLLHIADLQATYLDETGDKA